MIDLDIFGSIRGYGKFFLTLFPWGYIFKRERESIFPIMEYFFALNLEIRVQFCYINLFALI